jgi:2-(1,2-epoxy-1,2-dihydrophenyl)acetyl-CoA isomerase
MGRRLDGVTIDETDGIAVVTLSSPTTRNALSRTVLESLQAAISSPQVTAAEGVVLASDAKAFCAGGDLSAMRRALDGDLEGELTVMLDLLHGTIRALRRLRVPTVAAVDGVAVGAGIALALAADVRVVGRSAAFLPGYLQVGASPDGGASFFLARMLGSGMALSSFVLSRRFGADDLERLGLADEVVDAGSATSRAVDVAGSLRSTSPDALLAVRELVVAATTHDLDSHLDAEKAHFLSVARSPGFRRSIIAAT